LRAKKSQKLFQPSFVSISLKDFRVGFAESRFGPILKVRSKTEGVEKPSFSTCLGIRIFSSLSQFSKKSGRADKPKSNNDYSRCSRPQVNIEKNGSDLKGLRLERERAAEKHARKAKI